jgi:hypothetical protein
LNPSVAPRRNSRPKVEPRTFGGEKPLSLAALDAAISESIGKPVRADRLARDDRVFRWAVRRAISTGARQFNTTYAEAAAGAGYEVPRLTSRANRKEARQRRVSTIYRALCSLREAGLLRFESAQLNGKDICLRIVLEPAAFGAPPCGRSPRAPRRHPGHRVSFSSRSGSPPAVPPPGETAKKRVPVRAHASQGSDAPAQARRTKVSSRYEPRRDDWPLDGLEIGHQEAVELCDTFEAAFNRPARFSLRRHGERLERILARFDRFSGKAGWRAGAGVAAAKAIIEDLGNDARWGAGPGAKIGSLAYFLPILDEASKAQRRFHKRVVAPRWA